MMQSVFIAKLKGDKFNFTKFKSMTEKLFWFYTKFCFNSAKEIYIYREKDLSKDEFDELIRQAHKRFD